MPKDEEEAFKWYFKAAEQGNADAQSELGHCYSWSEAKSRQKDIDARWIKKNGVNHFGYKNHVQIDVGNKFIRHYEVTDAAVHDRRVFERILDSGNSNRDVFADSAYRSKTTEKNLMDK